MRWHSAAGFAILVVLLLPLDARPQAVPESLADLHTVVETPQGSTLYVTDVRGQRVKGRLQELSESSLTLLVDGTPRVISGESVVKIERGDSLENGFWLGLATALVHRTIYSTSGKDGFSPFRARADSVERSYRTLALNRLLTRRGY